MIRKIMLVAVIFLLGFSLSRWQTVHAQSSAPLQLNFTSTQVHTLCAVTTAQTSYCLAFDGLWMSSNGAAWVQMSGPQLAAVLSVNSHKPDSTGNVALTAATSIQ